MNILHDMLMLATAFFLVFIQTTVSPLRSVLGAQIDLLPSLMIYAGLTSNITSLTILATLGGLWMDSLSANPLGASVLPLFLIGFVVQRYRGLILRYQIFAQFIMGLAASAAAPIATLLIVLNVHGHPVIGWFSIWQWIVMALAGGVVTPVWFRVFDRLLMALSYQPLNENSFRPDREIKRGRS